ncbi:YfiT family bacillithiol transferase [Dyadobacter psychrotolerans]|uniref:DinB-like domain-containing protein n=1 Tax=Dyadobacter psychrotolerans TaxID=2541721 RepID=A0A4R5DSY2_9BACT|nr:DinB family protein [Dyadobacter psychrotolerans]TDE16867.1 hypothetical protein E0F88_11660 [Dyadobacter psychrotolerans]
MTDSRFPLGPFVIQDDYTSEELETLIDIIETIPADYRRLTENLTEADLSKTYREASWTIRQLVHHVADIQFLHYFRMKKALTEPDYKDMTVIDMNAWAATADSLSAPITVALQMFEGVHHRYAFLARTLTEEQLTIRYFHPARQIWFSQKQALAISVWHTQHHLAHIGLALGEV